MRKEFMDIMKALSDFTRIRILKVLEGGDLCVCQIVAILQLGQSSISQQLAVLRKTGLIEDNRVGRWVYYRLSEEQEGYIKSVLQLIRGSLEEDDIIQGDIERCQAVKEIPLDEMCSQTARYQLSGDNPNHQ